MSADHAQQDPISLYFKVWGLLFLLSFFSYMVDYMQVQGLLRWALVLTFMLLKAGLILSVFMHVKWERLALQLLLFVPLFAIVVFIALMAIEGDHTHTLRLLYFGQP